MRQEKLSAWILVETGQTQVQIWGLSPVERLRRALEAAGIPAERIRSGPASAMRDQNGACLFVRSDYIFDERLIRAMITSTDTVLLAPDPSTRRPQGLAAHVTGIHGHAVYQLLSNQESVEQLAREAGLRCLRPDVLVPAYTAALRKTAPPYLLPVIPDNRAAIEARIFWASYKGATDLVTKWVWPRPAYAVTQALARLGVHPNGVTLLSWVLVALAAVLFGQGRFGLGLAVAWVMTFLDTVDGKLARVTLTSSRIGHVLDHGLDLLHPPFWYLAWAIGLPLHAMWLGPAAVITIVGYVIGRLIEGVFLLVFKMEIHCWRPIDQFFRTITARRNPNLILLTLGTLAGRPDAGLLLVAAWTACSIGFHTVRLAQALAQRWRGQPVRVWQESESVA